MRELIQQFGRLRLLALVIAFLPFAAMPLAGVVWLWQNGHLLEWLLLLVVCAGIAMLLQWWLAVNDKRRTYESRTRADGNWSSTAEGAWEHVEELAETADPAEYPLNDSGALLQLAQNTLERVAGHFHPEKEHPLLALTLPHTLLIIERASRELRKEIVHTLPFSHRLSLGNLVQARRLQQTAARYHKAYRVGRALISPATAVYKEVSRAVSGHILDYGSDRLQRWLLQEYVRKVGFYAIELYSGNLLLSGELVGAEGRPLQVLVVGPAQSGKTSVIEALAGGETEPEAGDKNISVVRISSAEWGELELWDTPAWKSLPRREARRAVAEADTIIWVSNVEQLDADYEAEQLSRLHRWMGERAGQPEPPLLVALTYCEQGDALALTHDLAETLAVAPENMVALSLADPLARKARQQLSAAFALHHAQAVRSHYWRYLNRQRRAENREIAGRQLRNVAGSAWRTARGVFRRKKR
ncbi:GTPase [Gilvimarinus xylanilyticus]|uniref:GTPase domain-containing protein n=1 Tax=Gilvimarinus xylanilyticus TaxID=2944139 RepID=A0A9X2KUR2_9GAMM|nr:GTPase domain-containing protein [Gilvimarinus xylanilyticus]MCP8900629.1 GTPase domain-containing protein [Gilvimarinus xylanilyticus]